MQREGCWCRWAWTLSTPSPSGVGRKVKGAVLSVPPGGSLVAWARSAEDPGVPEKLLIGCHCISGSHPWSGGAGQGSPVLVSEGSLDTLGNCPNAGSLHPQTESSSHLHFCPNNLPTKTFLPSVFLLVTPGFWEDLHLITKTRGRVLPLQSQKLFFYTLTSSKWRFFL